MIVVVGSPTGRLQAGRVVAGGSAARIAMAIAASGGHVQLVGRVGDDASADTVLQDLARVGVGHVAILRDPARATPIVDSSPGQSLAPTPDPPEVDGPDVELALRYLTDYRVIVLVGPAAAAVADIVRRASEWGEATLVVALPTMGDTLARDAGAPEAAPGDTRVVGRGESEAEEAFETRVAHLAMSLDPDPVAD